VGAAIASAKIHLTDEIYKMQDELLDLVTYFNECLQKTDLPLITDNDSPVFYIGAGMPETGFNLVNRLIEDGFYVNTGIFPAVPVKNTGLRITISRNNQKEEIKGLVDALVKNFPMALHATSTNLERINFAFGRSEKTTQLNGSPTKSQLSLEMYDTIEEIDPELWNETVGGHGFFDWNGLKSLERIFQSNPLPEHNYQFFYYLIRDGNNKCILATFFSYGLWKEDMLAPRSVSVKLEKERETNPYLYTSSCLSMGSMITEGEHLYLCREKSNWKEALNMLLVELEVLEKKLEPQYLILRDFKTDDSMLDNFFHGKGFIKVAMPEAAVYDDFDWKDESSYIMTLSSRSRKHFRKDIDAFSRKLPKMLLTN
jgi:hypothetical protein